MAGKAYVAVATDGALTEERSVDVSSGAADAAKIPALDANGRLAVGFMPSGFGADTVIIQASEALAAGDFVNIWNSTGARARKADGSTTGREAHGFVLEAVSSGANATVCLSGENTAVTGKTIGAQQFLSNTAGASVEAPLTAAGYTHQRLGVAVSAASIAFRPSTPVVRA
jgi:hypothetical protein